MDENANRYLLVSRDVIALNYFKLWFWIDFFSTVPIDRIGEAIARAQASGGADGLRTLKMIRALRLIRLLKLARVLKLKKLQVAFSREYPCARTARGGRGVGLGAEGSCLGAPFLA